MENDYKYVEFKNDYVRKGRDIDYETDGFAFSITSIDGFTADPAEAGTVIANVFTTVHGDTFTNWHLSEYKDNPAAAACADEAAKKQKEEYAAYQKKTKAWEGVPEEVIEDRDGTGIAYRTDIFEKHDNTGILDATVLTSIHRDTVLDWTEAGYRNSPYVLSQFGDIFVNHAVRFSSELKFQKNTITKRDPDKKSKENSLRELQAFMQKNGLNIHDVLKDMGYVGVKLIHEEDLRDSLDSDNIGLKEAHENLRNAGITDEEIIEKTIPYLKPLEEMHEGDYITLQAGLEKSMQELAKGKDLTPPARSEKKQVKAL